MPFDTFTYEAVRAYVKAGFPILPDYVSVRRFDPPPQKVPWNDGQGTSIMLDRLEKGEQDVQNDIISQTPQYTLPDIENALDNALLPPQGFKGMGMGAYTSRNVFISQCLMQTPSAIALMSYSEGGRPAMPPVPHYITTYPSTWGAKEIYQSMTLTDDVMPDLPNNFEQDMRMLTMAREFGHVALKNFVGPPIKSEWFEQTRNDNTLADVFGIACTLSVLKQRALPSIKIYQGIRAEQAKGNKHLDTAPVIGEVLKMGTELWKNLDSNKVLPYAQSVIDRMGLRYS